MKSVAPPTRLHLDHGCFRTHDLGIECTQYQLPDLAVTFIH